MSEKELIKQLKKLPPGAQQEAADFVDYLYKKYMEQEEEGSRSERSVLDSPFRGMWKDREDMKDSTEWVRNIRKSRWAS